jgi:Lactonase, 7-bladed beta-propeller
MSSARKYRGVVLPRTFSFLRLAALFGMLVPITITLAMPQRAQARDRDDNDRGGSPRDIVYVQTNDYTPGQNAVDAYHRDPNSGCLTHLGRYYTQGTGVYNFDDRIGPDDHAQEVIVDRDRNLLFTVNGGSDTVSVFNIHHDGSLSLAPGSPVKSGGIQPVSLGLSGDKLYVVNQDGDPNRLGSGNPNYTGFWVGNNGKLTPIPNSTVQLPTFPAPINSSYPTQALISHDGRVFIGDLLTAQPYPPLAPPFLPPAGSLLQSYLILPNGHLHEAYNSPMAPPVNARLDPTDPRTGYTLGMDVHPQLPIAYITDVVTNRLNVFVYDFLGGLHYVTDTPMNADPSNPTDVTVCWVSVSPDGKWVFTSSAGSSSIAVFAISPSKANPTANALNPVKVGSIPLRLLPTSETGPIPGVFNQPSASFQLNADPSSNFVFSVAHELVLDNMYPGGNAVHSVKVGHDGTLSEPACSPVEVQGIPSGAHPQGIAVF